MSSGPSDHDPYEELAAGYALDALGAGEASRFELHLSHCVLCQAQLAAFHDVAASLGEAAPEAQPSPDLRERILLSVLEAPRNGPLVGPGPRLDHRAGKGSPGVTDLGGRRHHHRVRLLAAAVVLLLGGVAGALVATSGGVGSPPAPCTAATGCSEVTLTSALTHRSAAKVIVSGASVWLRPVSLAPNDTARQIYVLWELGPAKKPVALGSFDVTPGARRTIAVGGLALPYRDAAAFAVSLEQGRHIPRAPSDVVALGTPA